VAAATTLTSDPHVCAANGLVCPVARRAQARLYGALSLLSYTLPLPVAPAAQPDPPAVCATLLAFFQLGLGVALPLLAVALAEARAFARHQQQRLAAGLALERGQHAAVYEALCWLTMGGAIPVLAVLPAWLLLAVCWDWTSFFSVPITMRRWD
jgi:hypothetical protein